MTPLQEYRAIQAAQPPSPGSIVIAIAVVAVIALAGGLMTFVAGISDSFPAETMYGAAAFLFGWLLAGFSYALRRLQLIEWGITHRQIEERSRAASTA